MKIRTFTCLMLAGMLSLNSCVNNGDIDELQNQIDDLNSTVENLQKTQQEALLAAIADLEAELASLENELGSDINDLGTDYDALLADLGVLEEEVEGNANAVFYGNVISEDEYAALIAQDGATIITGRVVVTTDANVQALANVKLIGKSLEIKGGSTIAFDALQSVGEDLLVMGVNADATINLAKLSSVGGDVEIMNNTGLTSIIANELALISGGLSSEKNIVLTTISLAKLDQVGAIYVNEYVAENYDNPVGELAMLDLSYANVNGDVQIEYLGAVENLNLGNINGVFNVENSEVVNINLDATLISGAFSLNYNKNLKTVKTPNLKRIEGDLVINSNNGNWDAPGASLNELPSFPVLEYIGGNASITSNSDLTTADAFNSVTEITGNSINFSGNGKFESIDIFNALVDTYNTYSNASLFISAKTNWFNGFSEILELHEITITIEVPTVDDGGDVVISSVSAATTGVAKMEGFDKLTKSSNLKLYIGQVTEFNAFPSYQEFTWFNNGLLIQMPAAGIGMCSMETLFTKVKTGGSLQDRTVKFQEEGVNEWGWPESVDVDKDIAIDQLLAPCAL